MNNRSTRIMPKSLHTITSLKAIARKVQEHGTGISNADAVEEAAKWLTIDTMPDAYELKAKAVAMLNKEDLQAD